MYWYVGRPGDARQAFDTALAENPSSVVHKLWHADTMRAAGERDEGDAIVKDVLSSAPPLTGLDPEDIANLGWAHHLLGQYDDAARLLARALAKSPSLVWAQFDLALALLGGGDGDSGLREYERGVDQLRTFTDVRRRHGLVAVALFDLNEAYPRAAAQRAQPTIAPAPVPEAETARTLLSLHLQKLVDERDRSPVGATSAAS